MQPVAAAGAPDAGPELAPTEEELRAHEEKRKREEELRAQQLDALGIALANARSESISARQASGIEEEWLEDEEHYEGIDDANRGEIATWRSKPPGMSAAPGGGTVQVATASTVFPNITRPYVDAASARVSDMLLPTDDSAWSMKPTPVPELANIAKGKVPAPLLQEIARKYPGQPKSAQLDVAAAVKAAMQLMEEAKARAEKAAKRIEDWHVECQYHGEMRSVIEDCAKIGTGVLKGPVPVAKRCLAYDNATQALSVSEEIKPASKRVSAWNLYPDAACGENIHNGSHIFEKDDITRKQLERLKSEPGYIATQLDKCITEGPAKATKVAPEKPEPDGTTRGGQKDLFEIWYYHGYLTRDDLAACGCDVGGDLETPVSIPAQVTMVNNRVVKAVLNPLDTGEFPYDVMVWQKRSGTWTGIGVGRQIRTPQRMVTAATRNMMDNAGRAGGPQLVLLQGKVEPQDNQWEVTPWKIWLLAEDADLEHLDNAFRFVEIPMVTDKLLEIIQFGLKMAEDVTGLPLLLQGQVGKAPDTLGGMQMLNNNAGTVLRRIARLFDDRITEPHVRRYYAFLLQYGEDDEKGDYQIDARGSSALVERDLQNQAVVQMGPIVKDPAFGVNPRKWFTEYCKSQRLDPKRFQWTEDEQQRIDEAQAQQPSDPRVAVAQLQADLKDRLAQFEARSKRELQALEQNFEAHENERNRQLEYIVAEMQQKGQGSISFGELKAKLADTAMKLRTQRELSALDRHARQVAGPATEPKGRAKSGQAFAH